MIDKPTLPLINCYKNTSKNIVFQQVLPYHGYSVESIEFKLIKLPLKLKSNKKKLI